MKCLYRFVPWVVLTTSTYLVVASSALRDDFEVACFAGGLVGFAALGCILVEEMAWRRGR